MRALLLVSFYTLVACGDDTSPVDSGMPDAGTSDAEVRFSDLLESMHDPDRFLEPSAVDSFRSLQQSSQEPGGDDPTSTEWWNNSDKGFFRRMITRGGREEAVMMEAEGPGAIVRIWSANPVGNIRIYLDDMDTPAIEADMAALLGGEVAPYGEPFGYVASRGYNLYFPLPFAERAMVTADAGFTPMPGVEAEGLLYYHVGYRLYGSGAQVEPFSEALLAESAAAIDAAGAALETPENGGMPTPLILTDGVATTIEAPSGGGVIRALRIEPAANDAETLRSAVMHIAFDGVETIRAPLGDLFGSGVGLNAHRSVATEVVGGALWLRLPMAFEGQATFTLDGVDASGTAYLAPYPFSSETRHLHAGWRAYPRITAARQDLRWVELTGSGVYVGNVATYGNPVDVWWGEGDERIYVDGDAIGAPSFPGTGTEDYYGYAFIDPAVFTRPFHGQVRSGAPGADGIISLYRFHYLDAIPYEANFRFDMELWHWNPWVEASNESVHFWYARGGEDDLEPVNAGEATVPDVASFSTEM